MRAKGAIVSTAGVVLTGSVTDEGLQRCLTRFHALAIVVGTVVGTGIYLRPASIAQIVQSPFGVLTIWVAAGLFTLAGALTYAELASRLPRSGGEYAFLRETLGELPAFLFGWMRLTVGASAIAAMAVAVAVFVSDLVPLSALWWHHTFRFFGGSYTMDLGARQAVAVLLIFALAALNVSGVARAGRFQGIVTSAKVIGLAALIGVLAFAARAHAVDSNHSVTNGTAPGVLGYGGALLAALAPFNGWANAAMVGGEVRDARRTLPRALIVGICATILLYVAVNAAYMHVLSMDEIAGSSSTAHPDAPSVASRAAAAVLGENARFALTLLFLISAVGTLHCLILTPSRVLFAMARDGVLPRTLSRVAETTRTPAAAIIALATLGMVLAILGSYDRLSNMSAFGYLLFYPLNALGLIWWRRTLGGNVPDAFKAPRGVPQLFLLASVVLLVVLVVRGSVEVLAALALIGLGVPVYASIRARRARGSLVQKC
jgi:basic amino acid/polyamine antiporter, APA family